MSETLAAAAVARIVAALDLHRPCHKGRVIKGRGSTCAGYHPVPHAPRPVCAHCAPGTAFPCPTVLALRGDGTNHVREDT